MHELGIVKHVARTLDELAEENHITKIGSVTLEIGEVSGIMTELFTDCWNYFRVKHPLLTECEMKIETVHALTYCEGCGGTYDTIPHGRICPLCGSEKTWLLQGNECSIKEIEAETEE